MTFVIAFIASFIPYTALFLFLRRGRRDDPEYSKLCTGALGHGALSVLPTILFSGVSYIIVRLTGVQHSNPLLYQALYDFIVLALMEELAKYLIFRRFLKKTAFSCSRLDTTILMTIVGIGFGAVEAVIYSIGASIPVVLVRGICLPHAGYGFIVASFYGKGVQSGKQGYKVIGFLISWLLHGLYDFSLSEEFSTINDNLVIIPLLLALFDIALVILLIAFVRKERKREIHADVQMKETIYEPKCGVVKNENNKTGK